MSSFATGMDALNTEIGAAAERGEAARSGGADVALNYFKWEPGERKIIRFLTDDIITANFYDFILTNNGKTMPFMEDPSDPERLSRYMALTPGLGWRLRPGQALETPKASKRTLCMAVLRHEIPDPQNPTRTLIEDYTYQREVNGQTYLSRYFGLVQQGIGNFWHTLAVSCFRRFGSITTNDYEISREGKLLDTKYSILPLPEVAELSDPQVVKQFYFYGNTWNNEDPDRFLKCPLTNQEYAEKFSSEDRYKRLLTPLAPGQNGPTVQQVTTTVPGLPVSGPQGPGTPVLPTQATATALSGLNEFTTQGTSNPAPDEAQTIQSPQATSFTELQQKLINKARGN